MVPRVMRTRTIAAFALVLSSLVHAQSAGDEPPRIIIVPVTPPDAGAPEYAPPQQPQPMPADPYVTPAPPSNQPPAQPLGTPQAQPVQSRELSAMPDPNVTPVPGQVPPDALGQPVGAMVDGHPREGSFLSGPGSAIFILHHTLLGTLGFLSTQMIPRFVAPGAFDEGPNGRPALDQSARVAYLTAGLVGAALGFGSAAWWQFYNWIGVESAVFGIVNSIVGAAFMTGFTNLFTDAATPIAWMGVLGGLGGAWLTATLGGGEIPMNKMLLMTSGAGWAGIYTALILAIVVTSGGAMSFKAGADALLIAPAIGAGAMGLAALKFNPSIGQVVRADLFGLGIGAGVLLLSGIVVGARFDMPHPYILGGIASAAAITLVSLLYAEAAETAPAVKQAWWYESKEKSRPYSTVWW